MGEAMQTNDKSTQTNSKSAIKLEPSWLAQLAGEFEQPYMRQLKKFLAEQKRAGKVVYPPGDQYFNAFYYAPFDHVKVVILGQDPYHGPGQAHGLCFSVPEGVAVPPSLVNIYKELNKDLGMPIPRHGNLEKWAKQGVLLLNAVLTVEAGRANAHQGQGWELFTDCVIQRVNEKCSGIVFLLWGSYAQKKGALIDRTKHLVLQAPHPSPLSAHRGFIGCGHFSATNAYLQKQGKKPIEWTL